MILKRTLPVGVAIGVGILTLADFFLEDTYLEVLGAALVDWAAILSVFALILGLLSVLGTHLHKISGREEGWLYSFVLLFVVLVILASGLSSPQGPQDPLVQFIFTYIQTPLQASIFSLLVFFMATAAYRSLRVRNLSVLLMVFSALVVLIGPVITPGLKDWVLGVPATAGARGIIIGVALGTVATGLRILMGFDRPYAE